MARGTAAQPAGVSIYTNGHIALNVAAYEALGKPASVSLLYDADEQLIGFGPANAGDPDAYAVNERSRIISGQALCRTLGVSFDRTAHFPLHADGEIPFISLKEPVLAAAS